MHVVGPELLTQLLDEHGGALVLYAQQWCDTPEDVVQEALLRLMRQKVGQAVRDGRHIVYAFVPTGGGMPGPDLRGG